MPLFPLATVLFPGLVLPLRVFEERYRALVRDLLDRPDGIAREFGVVAIERGWEVNGGAASVGPASAPPGAQEAAFRTDMPVSFYPIGCTAEVRKITSKDDGTYDVVAVGRQRFEIIEMVSAGTPYLQARVRYLAESADRGEAEALGPRVLAAFRTYLTLIRADPLAEQLPDDPRVLSHLVAATTSLSLVDRQQLLAQPDTAGRLRAELRLLHREIALLRQVRAVPVAWSELPSVPGLN